ncbi:OmpA family protein [bacterium]|nr:OmpA family protein [bacterium]
MSLSDLMILLFILFVVLFSFTYKKMKQTDFQRIVATLRNEELPTAPIEVVHQKLREWVKQQHLETIVSVEKVDDSVLLQIKDKLLFESGGFELKLSGVTAIRTLQATLESVPEPYQIGVEGHTDDIPMHTKDIEDNWELSSKRAAAVFHALDLSEKTTKRVVLMAYGDTRPLAPNRDAQGTPIPENQGKNRRVTVKVF